MKTLFNGDRYADYYTFYLQDKASKQDYEALATTEGFEKMLAVGDQMLHINTRRYAEVPVKAVLFDKAPKLALANCDLANECSLCISTEALLGSPISGFVALALAPGIYRVRILYKNLGSVKSDFKGKDQYVLQIWPEQAMWEATFGINQV